MKIAEEIEKQIEQEAEIIYPITDIMDKQIRISQENKRRAYILGAKKYAAQDRWVKVDKDNLPTEKVFACNKHEEYLVGHIHLHNGIIVCSADETVLYYVTHYQIPTAPKD